MNKADTDTRAAITWSGSPRVEQGHIIPMIYVASLADYNAGRMVGGWLEANQPPERLREAIDQILARSQEDVAEEWAIHDCDGFGRWTPSEYQDLDTVWMVAKAIGEHGELFSEVLHYADDDIDRAIRMLTEGHSGPFDSPADYASEWYEECYGSELDALPDVVRFAIDWGDVAHELELAGDIVAIRFQHRYHVFDAHL